MFQCFILHVTTSENVFKRFTLKHLQKFSELSTFRGYTVNVKML